MDLIFFAGELESSPSRKHHDENEPRVLARAGTNMTLACPGLTQSSYVYLVEWRCIGCKCTGCPDPNGEGTRILRFNNELTRWDTAAKDEVARRTLDIRNYGLKFGPVSAEDTGMYLCLINNRREPDALLQLTVEGRAFTFVVVNALVEYLLTAIMAHHALFKGHIKAHSKQ